MCSSLAVATSVSIESVAFTHDAASPPCCSLRRNRFASKRLEHCTDSVRMRLPICAVQPSDHRPHYQYARSRAIPCAGHTQYVRCIPTNAQIECMRIALQEQLPSPRYARLGYSLRPHWRYLETAHSQERAVSCTNDFKCFQRKFGLQFKATASLQKCYRALMRYIGSNASPQCAGNAITVPIGSQFSIDAQRVNVAHIGDERR